jgi:hypothetical protein
MIELLEITVWDCKQENHTYFVSDNKQYLHAFRAFGSDQIVTFKKPLKFNTSKRKFKVIK